MIVTTTPTLEGQTIDQYLGLINGDAIVGVKPFKDVLASLRSMLRGRSSSYEQELDSARLLAQQNLKQQAETLAADAIVAVSLAYHHITLGNGRTVLMVSATGTAVKLKTVQTAQCPPVAQNLAVQ